MLIVRQLDNAHAFEGPLMDSSRYELEVATNSGPPQARPSRQESPSKNIELIEFGNAIPSGQSSRDVNNDRAKPDDCGPSEALIGDDIDADIRSIMTKNDALLSQFELTLTEPSSEDDQWPRVGVSTSPKDYNLAPTGDDLSGHSRGRLERNPFDEQPSERNHHAHDRKLSPQHRKRPPSYDRELSRLNELIRRTSEDYAFDRSSQTSDQGPEFITNSMNGDATEAAENGQHAASVGLDINSKVQQTQPQADYKQAVNEVNDSIGELFEANEPNTSIPPTRTTRSETSKAETGRVLNRLTRQERPSPRVGSSRGVPANNVPDQEHLADKKSAKTISDHELNHHDIKMMPSAYSNWSIDEEVACEDAFEELKFGPKIKNCSEIPECESGGKCLVELKSSETFESSSLGHQSLISQARCQCPLGRGGFLCQRPMQRKIPRFMGQSYLALPMVLDSSLWSLRLVFKPESKDLLNTDDNQAPMLIMHSPEFVLLLDAFGRIQLRYSKRRSYYYEYLNDNYNNNRNSLGLEVTRVLGSRDVELDKWNELIVIDASRDFKIKEPITGLNRIVLVTPDKIRLFEKRTKNEQLFVGGRPMIESGDGSGEDEDNGADDTSNSGLVNQTLASYNYEEHLTLMSGEQSTGGFIGCIRSLEINERDFNFKSDINGDALDGFDLTECCKT